MSDYHVTTTRSPTITDEEARRRLGQVYRLLLDLRRKKLAAASQTPSEGDPNTEPEEEPSG